MTDFVNFRTEFTGVSQHGVLSSSFSPCPSGHRGAHSVCPQCCRHLGSQGAALSRVCFSSLPHSPSGRTSSHGAFLPNAGGDRRGSRDTRAGPVPCEDVPAPSLTCPPPPPLPVPPDTMGGCFSKPKPGDCPPTPGPHPAVPVGEVGQRWMLAGGMLMLGSCREDYWALNLPKFLNALTSRQRAVGGCSSARAV